MGLLARLGLRRRSEFESLTLVDHLARSPLTLLTRLFYHAVVALGPAPAPPPRGAPPIRVVCLADTHDHVLAHVPPGDVLIHAGDLTNAGSARDIQRQLDWLRSLPHPVKVVVASNHDSFFDPRSRAPRDAAASLDLAGLLYLEGALTVQRVKGRDLAIFGAPDIPECGPPSFAFQYSPARQPWLSRVPPQTEILVTHGPPKHHLDLGVGCPHLLREVWRVKPRLHVFGHTHCAYGSEPVFFDDMQLAYERLLSRPPRGPLWDFVPNPAWADMAHVFVHGLGRLLAGWLGWLGWLGGAPASPEGCLMVNAAQMYKNTGRALSRAIVVDI